MFTSVRSQFWTMVRQKEFLFAFFVSTLYACIAFILALYSASQQDLSMIFDASQFICYGTSFGAWGYFKAILPFLVVLPFATSYIDDYNNHLLPAYVSRVSRGVYFSSKAIACFLGTAIVIFIPFLLNFLLCNIFLPHNTNFTFGEYQRTNYFRTLLGTNLIYETAYPTIPFLDIYLVSPQLYNFLYLFLLSGFAGLLGSFILSISFIWPRSKVLLFVPVFLIQRGLLEYDAGELSRAIKHGSIYINWDLIDYVIPSISKGKSPYLIGAVIVILMLFIIVANCYATRRDLRSLQ